MRVREKMLLADAAILAAAICWGGGFAAGDIAVENFDPFLILTIRFLGAATLMGILFPRIIRKSGKQEILAGMLLGTILFLIQPLQTIALRYTMVSKQAFLVTAHVAVTPFVSWLLLQKRPEKKSFFVSILMLCGIGFISLDSALRIERGDLLSICFAIGYSFLVVMTGKFSKSVNPIGMSFYQYLTTGTLSLVAVSLFEEMPAAWPSSGIWALIYLATINTVVAYTVQNIAQRYTTDTHASLLISTESVFGYLISVLMFGEPFTLQVLLGGVIVFAAVLLSEVDFSGLKK